jgi:hypothetical protein
MAVAGSSLHRSSSTAYHAKQDTAEKTIRIDKETYTYVDKSIYNQICLEPRALETKHDKNEEPG